MTTINPWINFNGNAEEAFLFYQSIFGGEFSDVIRFKDVASEQFPVEETDAEKLMKIVLPIGNEGMLIGNDVPAFMGTTNENENRSKIHVLADSQEDALALFNGLSAEGQVEVPLEDAFCMFRDKYGIEWVIEFIPAS